MRSYAIALVVAVLSSSALGAQPAPLGRTLAGLAESAGAVEAVRRHEADRLHAGRPVAVIQINLLKAVLGKDVDLSLERSAVYGTRGSAKLAMLNPQPYAIDANALVFAGDEKNGSAEGTIALTLSRGTGWESWVQDLFAGVDSLTVDMTLKARWQDGKLGGTYKFAPRPLPLPEKDKSAPPPLKESAGDLAGTFRTVTKLPPPAPPATAFPDAPARAFLAARLLEQAADEAYYETRVLNLVRKGGLSYAEAAGCVLRPRTSRPPLAAEKATAGEKLPAGKPASGKKPKPKPAAPRAGGGLDLEGGDEESPEIKSGQPAEADPLAKAAGEQIAVIASRVEQMRRVAEAFDAAPDAATNHLRETLTTDDPEFGPWWGETALKASEVGANVLPPEATAPSEGAQIWQSVARWQALGPLPLTPFERVTPRLPDLVMGGNEVFRAQAEAMPSYSGDDLLEWTDCAAVTGRAWGYVAPPRWFSFNPYSRGLPPTLGYREYANLGHTGCPYTTVYMRCTIDSPSDANVWAGLGVNQRGRLWVNDRLLWEGPTQVDPLRHETVSLLRIPLRKGANRLVLRIDTDFSSTYCWLRLCVAGRPRSAAEVKAKAEAAAALLAGAKRETVVGWRGDGTGQYRGANPPVAWNQKAKQNVLWHTPMPYWGNASPVPVPGTNKLLITMNPHWLICLDKDTGRELWRRAVTLIDLLPEEQRKKGWELAEAWWKARETRDRIPAAEVTGMKYKVSKWLQYQWYWAEGGGIWAEGKSKARNEREGAPPELVALLDKRDELEKSPDPASVQDQLNAVLKQIEKLQAKLGAKDPDSPESKEARMREAEAQFVGLLREHSHTSGMGGGYWEDYAGWMFATPVTDGRFVWLKTGTDVAACFDLDGNEKWKVQTWGGGVSDHTLCSPRLVDGRFILQLNNRKADPRDGTGRGIKVLALDAASGAKVWETPDLPDHAWNDSTPAVVTLCDGRSVMKVIVTTCGTVLRAEDGKVLVFDPGVQGGFASPLVEGDVVIFGAAGLAAVQYIMHDRDTVGFKRLWAVRGGSHGLLDSGGAVIADGRIWHTVRIDAEARRTGQGHAALGVRAESGAHEGWRAAEGYELSSGRYAGAVPILRKGGSQWTPASAADKVVYHIAGDHIFQSIGPKAPMDMVAVTREDPPLRLANNAIDRTYGCGAIEGERIYIRGYYGVTCVARTGEEGARYEARTVARNLMDDMPARPWGQARPGQGGTVRDVPMAGSQTVLRDYPYQHPRSVWGAPRNCLLLSGQPPHRWWLTPPLAPDAAEAALTAFGGPAAVLHGDDAFKIGDKELVWGPMCQSYLNVPGFKEWELDGANFADIHRVRRVSDLGKALKGAAKCVVFVMTEFRSDRKQVMRFEACLAGPAAKGMRAWIGGTAIADGDRVRFGEGVVQLLMQIPVEEIPAEGLGLSPRFWASDDAAKEAADWDAYAKRVRPYLETVVRVAPDSPEAAQAKAILHEQK